MMTTRLFSIFFLLFGVNCTAQELIGPDRTLPGTLAAFEIVPPQEASWHIATPHMNAETYPIDTGLSKLYFASPVQGPYTVIAGIIENDQPKLLVKTFTNGEEEVRPIPPVPPPASSLEEWIVTQAPILVKSKNFVTESQVIAGCFEQIVKRIDAKNIKTVQNARSQLQITLTASLTKASRTAVTDWTPFLTELSRQLENELGNKIIDLEEVKKTLQTVVKALKIIERSQAGPVPCNDCPKPSTLKFRPTIQLFQSLP